MKTQTYNPSGLEVAFAQAFTELKPQLQELLGSNQITEIKTDLKADNPQLIFALKDADGDLHEVVVKIIQRIDATE